MKGENNLGRACMALRGRKGATGIRGQTPAVQRGIGYRSEGAAGGKYFSNWTSTRVGGGASAEKRTRSKPKDLKGE